MKALARFLGRALRGRRVRIAAAIGLILGVGLRVSLPGIVRSAAESQADAAIAGRVRIGDVDLWLLRGAVALEKVELRADGQTAEEPPVVAFERLYVNLGWFALLRHTVRLQTVELDGLRVDLERTRTGEVPLPGLKPAGGPSPSESGAPPGEPWNVVVDRAAIRGAVLSLLDHVPDPPQDRRLDLDGVELTDFSFLPLPGPDQTPGRASIEARFGDGTLRLGAGLDSRTEGFSIDASLEVRNLPLEHLQVHVPELGWSRLAGRLEGSVSAQIPPAGLPTLQGRLALRDLAVSVSDPDTGAAAGADAGTPILAWRRFEVEADSIDANARTVSLARLEIDGPAVTVVRARDGGITLPLLRGSPQVAAPPAGSPVPEPTQVPAPIATPQSTESPGPGATLEPTDVFAPTAAPESTREPAPSSASGGAASPAGPVAHDESDLPGGPAPGPQPAEPPPWDVYVGKATLTDGRVTVVDRAVEPAESLELELDGISISGFALRRSPDRGPGEGAIEARFGDGTVRIETVIDPREAGFAIEATVTAKDVPLDRLYLHVPELGWSDFRGRLDSRIVVTIEPDGLPVASGTLAIRDLQADVAGEPAPVLAWRRLEVDAESIDPGRRRAAIRRVFLEGAGVVVRPRDPVPLPLLAGLVKPGTDAAPEPADAAPAPGGPSWAWSVGEVEVVDSGAGVLLEPPALAIVLSHARATGLSNDLAAPIEIELEVREGEGALSVRGSVTPQPLAMRLATRAEKLALARLAAAAGGVPVALRRGAASGDLTVALAAGDLEVGGKLSVDDLEVGPHVGGDFSVAWRRLDLDLRKVSIPGAVAEPLPSGAIGTPEPEPILVDLERVSLLGPKLLLTRTAEGIVLPGGDAPTAVAAPAEPGSAAEAADLPAPTPTATPTPEPTPTPTGAPAPAPSAASAPPVLVRVGRLEVSDGDATVIDRTVQPFFRGQLSSIGLRAGGLRFPEATFQSVELDAKLTGGAPLEVRSRTGVNGITIDAKLDGLPLPPLNPYVGGALGYSIASGRASLASSVFWGPTYYEASNWIALDALDLAGAEGDTLFADRFGIPLSLAIALLKSPSGQISLDIPVEGNREDGARVALAPIVGQALTQAILGAITSPLKLIGAVAFGGGKVEAVAPAPIAFEAGEAEVAADAWWRLAELSNALGSYPGLGLTLRGTAGDVDRRAMQEAAVLADLQKDQGVLGVLRTLGSRGDRIAVREYLEARAAGKEAVLEEDRRPALEEWVAEKVVTDEDLRALAASRAERLKGLLETDYGVGAARLGLAPPGAVGPGVKPEVVVGIRPAGS